MQLPHLIGAKSAAQDGVMMFDPAAGVPVFSQGGVWVPVAVFAPGRAESGIAASGSVVFDEAFTSAPVVVAQPTAKGAQTYIARVAEVSNVTTTGFDVRLTEISTAYGEFVKTVSGNVAWLAVGA